MAFLRRSLGLTVLLAPSYRVVAITDLIYIRGRHRAPARAPVRPSLLEEPMSHAAPSRTRVITVALAAVCVAASGCTVANSGHGGYDPNTLRIVLSQEPPTLEPCESSLTSTGIVVRSNITEPLIERDPDQRQPAAAAVHRLASDLAHAVGVRHPRRCEILQRRTVHGCRTRRSPSTGPSTPNCSATSTATCSATRSSSCRPPTTTPSLSAPRSRIRFCRCVFPSSRSCPGPPAPPRRSASRSAPGPTPSRTGSTARN